MTAPAPSDPVLPVSIGEAILMVATLSALGCLGVLAALSALR